jgi:hypothetical protein
MDLDLPRFQKEFVDLMTRMPKREYNPDPSVLGESKRGA